MVGLRAAKAAQMRCLITYTSSTVQEDFYGEVCSNRKRIKALKKKVEAFNIFPYLPFVSWIKQRNEYF
jgi:hypothetical protein